MQQIYSVILLFAIVKRYIKQSLVILCTYVHLRIALRVAVGHEALGGKTPMDEAPRFLTEREVAAQLRCSIPAIRAWRRKGLPAHRFGRLVRFRLCEVLAWFAEHEETAA